MQGVSKHSLLDVVCGGVSKDKQLQDGPFTELASYGHLEVQSLTTPSVDEFRRTLETCRPSVVYFRGQRVTNEDIGSLRLNDVNLSTPKAICDLFGSVLPNMVYLKTSDGERMAEAIHSISLHMHPLDYTVSGITCRFAQSVKLLMWALALLGTLQLLTC